MIDVEKSGLSEIKYSSKLKSISLLFKKASLSIWRGADFEETTTDLMHREEKIEL